MPEETKLAGEQPVETAEQAGSASARPARKRRKKKTTTQLLIDFLIKLVIIAGVAWALLTFVVGLTIHYGNNMFPAIKDGDLVIAYRLQDPYLNAAVLYEHDGELRLGRVVAMSGSEVEITEEGAILVNGTAPAEEIFYATYPADEGGISYPYTVGEGEVFILNDFRSDTDDSRSFGAIDADEVVGPVLLTMRRRGF